MRQREIAVRLSLGATRAAARAPAAHREPAAGVRRRRGRRAARRRHDARAARVRAGRRAAAADQPVARLRASWRSPSRSRSLTGVVFGLLPALRASRPDTWGTLKDTVGAVAGSGGSLFLRKGLVAAQVALSFLLLFGAGLFVQSLQNLKRHRHRRGARQPRHLPAVAGAQRLRRRAHRHAVLRAAARAAAGGARRHVGGVGHGADPERRRVGQHDVGRRAPGQGRRGHAGVHEHAVARLLRRRWRSRCSRAATSAAATRSRKRRVAIVNRRFAEHFFPGKSAIGTRTRLRRRARHEARRSRSSAWRPTRSTRGRAKACGGRCSSPSWGKQQRRLLRAHAAAPRRARSRRSAAR